MNKLPISLNANEYYYFKNLFDNLCKEDGLTVDAKVLVKFFKRAENVKTNDLKIIWLKCCSHENLLSEAEFYKALLYIGLKQNDIPQLPGKLADPELRFIPQFKGNGIPSQLINQNAQALDYVLNNPSVKEENHSNRIDVKDGVLKNPDYQKSMVFDQINGETNNDSFNKIASQYNSDLVDQGRPSLRDNDLLPNINEASLISYEEFVRLTNTAEVGIIKSKEAVNIFNQSGLEKNTLRHIWELTDRGRKGLLGTSEYIMALHLIALTRSGYVLPMKLPNYLRSWIQDYDSRILKCENASFNNNVLTSKYINMDSNISKSRYSTRSSNQLEAEPEDHKTSDIWLSPNVPITNIQSFNVQNVSLSNKELDFQDEILHGYSAFGKKQSIENRDPNDKNAGNNFYHQCRTVDMQIDKAKSEMNNVCLEILKQFDVRVTLQREFTKSLNDLENNLLTQEIKSNCHNTIKDIHDSETSLKDQSQTIQNCNLKLQNVENDFNLSQIELSNSKAKLVDETFDSQLDDVFGQD